MKRGFLIVLLLLMLAGCGKAEVVLDYSLNELLPDLNSTELSADEGLLYSDLVNEEYYAGIYTNIEQNQDKKVTYKRYISPHDLFLVHIEDISHLIGENINQIKRVFENSEDIGHIVINSNLGILSILPKDIQLITDQNSVILDLPENYKLWEEECEYCNPEVTITYDDASGFDFRDIIVAQLNLEYSKESMDKLSTYAWHGFTWLSDEFSFIDVMVEEESGLETTSFVWIEDDLSRGIIGHEGQHGNFSFSGIPLVLNEISSEENVSFSDDYVLSTNFDLFPNESCIITFYKVRLN